MSAFNIARICLLTIASLYLSGCASVPPTLFTGVRTVEVVKPVVQPCISVEQVPVPPRSEMPLQGDAGQLRAGLKLDLNNMDAYIEQVDKMLRECAAK